MSSLRRTLCTAVGLAALGAAFAAPAFAEPELPSAPSTDQLGSAPDILSGLPAAPTVPDLPPAFAVPRADTAFPQLQGALGDPATYVPHTQVGGLPALGTLR